MRKNKVSDSSAPAATESSNPQRAFPCSSSSCPEQMPIKSAIQALKSPGANSTDPRRLQPSPSSTPPDAATLKVVQLFAKNPAKQSYQSPAPQPIPANPVPFPHLTL